MKKIIVALIVIGITGYTGVRVFGESKETVVAFTPPTYTLSDGQYDFGVPVAGTITASEQVTVKAEVPGVVETIYAEAGDEVAAEALLVALNADNSSVAYQSVVGQLGALESLYSAREQASSRQIDVLNDTIKIARSQYNTLSTQQASIDDRLASMEAEANAAASAARTAVEELRAQREIALGSLYGRIPDAIRGAYIVSTQALDTVGGILTLDGYGASGYSYDRYLGNLDSGKKNIAEEKGYVAIRALEALEPVYKDVQAETASNAALEQGLKDAESVLVGVLNVLQATESALSATAKGSSDLSASEMAVISLGNQVQQALLSTSNTGVRALRLQLDEVAQTYDSNLRNAEAQAAAAAERVTTVRASAETEKTELVGQLQVLATQISQAEQSLRMGEQEQLSALSQIRAQMHQLDGVAQATALQIGDASVESPMDGVVVEKFVSVGDAVQPGMPLLTVAAGGPREVHIQIADGIAKYLSTGDTVTVEDRTNGMTVTGTIDRIHPAVREQDYTVQVEIVLPEESQDMWILGEVVSVTLPEKLQEQDAVRHQFHIPVAYVGFSKDGPFVETVDGERIPVVIIDDLGHVYIVQSDRLQLGDEYTYPTYLYAI